MVSLVGIQPSPVSVSILENSLAVLGVLAEGNFTASDAMVHKYSAVSILLDLCHVSPLQHISTRAMNVLLNIVQSR